MLTESTLKRLETRQEELAILFLEKSDPKDWEKIKRGDAYWEKKNAAQALGLVVRIQSLLNMQIQRPDGYTQDDQEQEQIAANAERDAVAVIERVRARTSKK